MIHHNHCDGRLFPFSSSSPTFNKSVLTIVTKAPIQVSHHLDPSAAPPPLFRLARTKSGWRAGAPTKIRLAAAGDFSGGGGGRIRRDLVNGGTSHY